MVKTALMRRAQELNSSTGLSIREAPKLAESVLEIGSNAIKPTARFMPMGDRVLVRRIPEAVRSFGGISFPETGKTPAAFGVVVGVGQGRYNIAGQLIPVRLEVGAVVMFGKYAGTDVELFGVGASDGKCVNLREEEIMGVVMAADEAQQVAEDSDPTIHPVTQ